jgi:hypothetical protein
MASCVASASFRPVSIDTRTWDRNMAKKIENPNLTKQTAPSMPDQGGVTTILGGQSTAIGQDTLAEGSVSLQVKDAGPVTIVRGTTTFSATAQSTDSPTAYATADTFAEVSGADRVHTKTKTMGQLDQGGDTDTWDADTWSATSTTRVFAIDVEGRTLPNSPASSKHQVKESSPADIDDVDIDGNVAMVQADALVEGENTYASVDTSVLAVEDTLSTVNVSITTGIA